MILRERFTQPDKYWLKCECEEIHTKTGYIVVEETEVFLLRIHADSVFVQIQLTPIVHSQISTANIHTCRPPVRLNNVLYVLLHHSQIRYISYLHNFVEINRESVDLANS